MRHFYQPLPGFFWFEECYRRLLNTLPLDRPSHFVELGSFLGKSLAWLGVEILNRGLPTAIHAVDSFAGWIDVPDGEEQYRRFRQNIEPLVEPLGPRLSVYRKTSLEAAPFFVDGSVDVVFVDASHEYLDVKADILAWWPKLKPGGFMAGDDFLMTPVNQAVIEVLGPTNYILCHGWTTNPTPQVWPSWMARKS